MTRHKIIEEKKLNKNVQTKNIRIKEKYISLTTCRNNITKDHL